MTRTTAAAAIDSSELSETELEVMNWRLEQLLAVGFSSSQAALLAMRREVDLGQVRSMIAQGCPVELALRILV